MKIKKIIHAKKGQEEMLGFALIMIIVAVILVIFLGFSLRKSPKEAVESYEVESFIQSVSSYSTECGNFRNPKLSVRDLIFECKSDKKCLDGTESCDVLKNTIKNILNESWKVGANTPIIGYEFKIVTTEKEIVKDLIPPIVEGNKTANSRGSKQDYSQGGILVQIYFTGYY